MIEGPVVDIRDTGSSEPNIKKWGPVPDEPRMRGKICVEAFLLDHKGYNLVRWIPRFYVKDAEGVYRQVTLGKTVGSFTCTKYERYEKYDKQNRLGARFKVGFRTASLSFMTVYEGVFLGSNGNRQSFFYARAMVAHFVTGELVAAKTEQIPFKNPNKKEDPKPDPEEEKEEEVAEEKKEVQSFWKWWVAVADGVWPPWKKKAWAKFVYHMWLPLLIVGWILYLVIF